MKRDQLAVAVDAANANNAGVQPPLLEIRGLQRDFPAGDGTITVLADVNLDIHAGEMVAIIGASGSGKSTLMNILGCLDQPSAGSYRVAGRSTADLDADELAELRREHFGFIFQRYHLLGDLSALGNVEVPAVYAGTARGLRRERAAALLTRLGLADRLRHKPGQLSGGQQQRVSIARALMNGGRIILADEPTGALDTHSGAEVMKILRELHAEGHTIVLITHDADVAAHADRVIELRDGRVVADRPAEEAPAKTRAELQPPPPRRGGLLALRDRFTEAFRMALLAMNAHRLRTFLTMLGIIIGIASVVSVVALGEGSRQAILNNISAMGTNTIEVFSGNSFGDLRAARVRTLVPSDADALAGQTYVDSVTPNVRTNATLRFDNIAVGGTVIGVAEQHFRVRGVQMALGRSFDASSVARAAQEVVIDDNTRKQLFPDMANPVGQTILLGQIPCVVIGVARRNENAGSNDSLNVWVPYTAVMTRMTGQSWLRSITVRISDDVTPATAEQGITKLLTQRHGRQDFFLYNTDTVRQTAQATTKTMTMLISTIAMISLLVGGIGVMNIMLVSVTERTREIGVRMAIGARRGDIRQQFLIEAVLVCLLGGLLGIGMSLLVGWGVEKSGSDFVFVYSTMAMVAAFVSASVIGVVFGFLPANSAAKLNPVEALSRE
jgi:macrolide transport system ATP-binding/permease protein